MGPIRTFALSAVAVACLATACGGSSTRHAAKSKAHGTTTASDATTNSVDPTTAASSTTRASSSTSAPTATTIADGGSTTTTAPATATTTPANACFASDDDLAKTLIAYAKSAQPTVPVTVEHIIHATADHTWVRADVVPMDTSTADGFIAFARCVGAQWTVVDAGTSGVGCSAPVPASVSSQLGVEC